MFKNLAIFVNKNKRTSLLRRLATSLHCPEASVFVPALLDMLSKASPVNDKWQDHLCTRARLQRLGVLCKTGSSGSPPWKPEAADCVFPPSCSDLMYCSLLTAVALLWLREMGPEHPGAYRRLGWQIPTLPRALIGVTGAANLSCYPPDLEIEGGSGQDACVFTYNSRV